MFVCSNCKEEYREGFSICADCGEKIIEVSDFPQKECEIKIFNFPQEECEKEDMIFSEPTFLYSADDDVNADILITALKNNEIPVMVKKNGMGGYLKIYMNMNIFGIEIYVPAVMLEKSKEILNNIILENNSIEETDSEFEAEIIRTAKNKMIKGWVILAVFFGIPALIGFTLWLLSR